jgi:hypothetical protein
MTPLSYIFLIIAVVALVLYLMRRSANRRARGR